MEKVSNRQLFFLLLFAVFGGLNVISLSGDLAVISGSGEWLTVIMTGIIFFIPLLFYIYLGNLFPDKRMSDYAEELVGKFFSKVIVAIFLIYFLASMMLFLRGCGEFIQEEFLYRSPVLAIIIAMVLAGIYAASKTITDIGRIFEFLGVFILSLIIIIHIIMFLNGKTINMKPFFEPHRIGQYARGIFACIGAFTGLQVLQVIPFHKSAKKSKRNWYLISAFIALILLYIFVIESTYSILDMKVKDYADALIIAIRQISVPYLQILSRLDVLFIISWMFLVFCTLSLNLHAAKINLLKLFNLKRTWLPLIGISIVVVAGAMIPVDYHRMQEIFERIINILSAVVLVVIPVILIIAAKVKKISSKKEPEEGAEENVA